MSRGLGPKEPLKNHQRNVLSSCSHWYWSIAMLHLMESFFFTNQRNCYGNKDGTFIRQHLHGETWKTNYTTFTSLSWFRFIDVDMRWTGSEENLHRFFDHDNNVHPTIKFTHETSRTNISFLDTYITCENGIMSSDIYNKPTDKHKYLSPELSSKTLHQKYSVQPSSPNQTHLLQWTNYQKTSWGTEMSSEKEGLHYNASINHCFNKASGIDRKDLQYRKKRIRTTECHLSSHTILCSVMYTTSFVNTGQPYRNTQNCAKYSKNNPSWLSENPKIWKIYWWELTSPFNLPILSANW
jgi:hypothetical protein